MLVCCRFHSNVWIKEWMVDTNDLTKWPARFQAHSLKFFSPVGWQWHKRWQRPHGRTRNAWKPRSSRQKGSHGHDGNVRTSWRHGNLWTPGCSWPAWTSRTEGELFDTVDARWISESETNVALVFVQGETPSLESIRRLIQEELAKELQGETDRVESERYSHVIEPSLLASLYFSASFVI